MNKSSPNHMADTNRHKANTEYSAALPTIRVLLAFIFDSVIRNSEGGRTVVRSALTIILEHRVLYWLGH